MDFNFRLLAIAGPVTASSFPIDPSLTVGKAADNMLCIIDKTLSDYHFRLEVEDSRLWLYDGDSTNGTWVDGEFHSRIELQHGARIEAGINVFIVLKHPDTLDAFAKLKDEIDQEQWRIQREATFRIDHTAHREAAVYYKDVLKAMGKMGTAVNAMDKMDELLAHLAELTFDVVPARRVAILLNGRRISPVQADMRFEVYREHEAQENAPPFCFNSLSTKALDAVYDAQAAHMAIHPEAVVCVPLIKDGRMCGVLYVEGTEARTGFHPEHLQFLAMIADFVISAYSTADAFQDIRRQCEVLKAQRPRTDLIIGKSMAIQSVLDLADAAAQSDIPVLIVGETGTGKELLAKRIHEHSSRADKCKVDVNCPAVQESLFESELFGHEKGSFTGAAEEQDGQFQLADGGTLFLDEIGELGINLQPKLLRALQEGEIRRVGGKTLKVDVRIVAATNVDLQKAIREGKFRQDLFYRLHGIMIRVPPLREHREDIPLLVDHFIKMHGKVLGVTGINPEALAAIQNYDWPGNVRELEQVIYCAAVLAKPARLNVIGINHLPGEVVHPTDSTTGTLKEKIDKLAEDARRAAARAMMQECQGDAKRAASRLGISKRYLYYLLE